MICRARLLEFAEIVDTPPLPQSLPTQHIVLAKRSECIDITCTAFSQKISHSVPRRQYEFRFIVEFTVIFYQPKVMSNLP